MSGRLDAAALIAAGFAADGSAPPTAVAQFYQELRALVVPRFTASLTINGPHGPIMSVTTEGESMATSAQMTVDNTNAVITLLPEDDHGDVTPDQVTWTFSDNGAVVTPTVSADTHTVTLVPVAEGTVTITGTDPSSPTLSPTVFTLDVTAGATSQLVGNITVTP